MNTLSQQFNDQANWSIFIAPLFALLILDDIERRKKRRRAFVSELQRNFQETSVRQSREQYRRQIVESHAMPKFCMTGPRP